MPRVLNKYRDVIPSGAVYIGRPSPYGNPYTIGPDGTRDQVYEKFKVYLRKNKKLQAKVKKELKGRDLVCFCKPKRCHGDLLLRFANYEG